MKTYHLDTELKIFGMQVTSFPDGVAEVFDRLVNMIPGGFTRSFYGVSFLDENGKMVYIAAAEQLEDGEASRYGCAEHSIEKGDYLVSVINDWRTKTDCINDVFHDLMQNAIVDLEKPCVEWYRNDDEMWCMVKVKQEKNVPQSSKIIQA